jgi:hypothetical protein
LETKRTPSRPLLALRLLLLTLAALLLAAPLQAQTQEPTIYRLNLPLLGSGGPRGLLGVEASRLTPDRDLEGLAAMAPGWVRRGALRWRDVEPLPGGGYRWDAPAVQAIEAELTAAAQRGLRVVLVVHGSPEWAVDPYRVDCAPINPQHYDDYARFLEAAVARYSAPPYNVKHWELGNEPDAFVFTSDSPFGCWGRPDEELYGGQAYGELLKVAYPAVKRADPQSLVLHGGLLLEQPYDPATGNGRAARFLEGVLAAGAGNSFDILAFHSYSYYNGTPDGSTGGQDWKPAYLRALLDRHGLTKPLFNTEGALLCQTPSAECAEAQAYAMGRLYVRALRDNLLGYIWYIYDSDSFRHTALVEPQNPSQRRPAYAAFATAAAALGEHQYAGPVEGLPAGVEGHMLTDAPRTTFVLWANTPTTVALVVGAAGTVSCTAWNGAALPCAPAEGVLTLEVGPGPIYVSRLP